MTEITDDLLTNLANRMGIATEQIFDAYTKGIKNVAKIEMVFIIVFLIGLIPITCAGIGIIAISESNSSYSNRGHTLNDFDSGDFVCLAFVLAIAFVVWFVVVFSISLCASNYYCSEYIAIKEMLSVIQR